MVGTFPLSIIIEGSDLDIICQYYSLNRFRKFLNKTFKEENNFCITKSENTIICNFSIDSFTLEIFGQKIPTHQQNGYKHMIIEYFILKEKGNIFRDKIIELKKMGYKTEPAFAKLLGISRDPYKELLNYKFGSQLSLLENK